jgi:hypothetical protein
VKYQSILFMDIQDVRLTMKTPEDEFLDRVKDSFIFFTVDKVRRMRYERDRLVNVMLYFLWMELGINRDVCSSILNLMMPLNETERTVPLFPRITSQVFTLASVANDALNIEDHFYTSITTIGAIQSLRPKRGTRANILSFVRNRWHTTRRMRMRAVREIAEMCAWVSTRVPESQRLGYSVQRLSKECLGRISKMGLSTFISLTRAQATH